MRGDTLISNWQRSLYNQSIINHQWNSASSELSPKEYPANSDVERERERDRHDWSNISLLFSLELEVYFLHESMPPGTMGHGTG